MGTTVRWAFRYPDPTSTVDVPRDIRALAEDVDTRLWNGVQAGEGDFHAGQPSVDVTHYLISSRKNTTNVQCSSYWFCRYDGSATLTVVTGGVPRTSMGLDASGNIWRTVGGIIDGSGATYRYVPFAQWNGEVDVAINNSRDGSAAVTLPVGLFTQLPAATATVRATSYRYAAHISALSSSSITIGISHLDATAVTGTISAHVHIWQATATAGRNYG